MAKKRASKKPTKRRPRKKSLPQESPKFDYGVDDEVKKLTESTKVQYFRAAKAEPTAKESAPQEIIRETTLFDVTHVIDPIAKGESTTDYLRRAQRETAVTSEGWYYVIERMPLRQIIEDAAAVYKGAKKK